MAEAMSSLGLSSSMKDGEMSVAGRMPGVREKRCHAGEEAASRKGLEVLLS